MKKIAAIAVITALTLMVAGPFAATPAEAAPQKGNSCWGQASKVFAKMGEMGAHSSAQATPRAGLRNLARALADGGVIPDDSMQSLGAFVADALGLSIAACQ